MASIVWVTCIFSVLGGVLHSIKPNSKFDRQLGLLLSCIFLLGVLTALVKGVNRFTISQDDATELVEEAKQEVLEETCIYAAETLDASLTELLAQEEIVAQVTTEMYITEDSSIEIEQVTVQCHGAQEERIRELLGAYLGEDEVLYVETVETSSDDVASE